MKRGFTDAFKTTEPSELEKRFSKQEYLLYKPVAQSANLSIKSHVWLLVFITLSLWETKTEVLIELYS